MNTATLALDPLRPQRLGGWGRGVLLALVAHIGLVVALALATRWRTESETVVAAELWSAVPQMAAPKPVEPEPEPEPPKPEPLKPEPVKPPPPPQPSAAELQAQREADIAVERERLRKERLRQEAEREADRRRAVKEREEREQRERAAKEKAQKDKEKAEKERADREKAAREREKAEKQAERDAEKRRQENLRRIQGLAGASGAPDATGTALQSGAPSASYLGRIVARIKPNIVFTEDTAANPRAVVVLRIAPDGSIVGRRLKTPSGDAAWDEAVLRAIDRTAVLPRDTDGRVPPELEIGFRPRE